MPNNEQLTRPRIPGRPPGAKNKKQLTGPHLLVPTSRPSGAKNKPKAKKKQVSLTLLQVFLILIAF